MPLILVVDDDPSIRMLLEVALGEMGEVVVACDGAEALAYTATTVPDLAVLDVMMPEISGLTVLERWRQDERTAALPVIMLSARDQQVDREAGYRAGADAYVSKPFQIDVLLTLLRTLMAEQRGDAGNLIAELRALAGLD